MIFKGDAPPGWRLCDRRLQFAERSAVDEARGSRSDTNYDPLGVKATDTHVQKEQHLLLIGGESPPLRSTRNWLFCLATARSISVPDEVEFVRKAPQADLLRSIVLIS
jgi:hypothetical protein